MSRRIRPRKVASWRRAPWTTERTAAALADSNARSGVAGTSRRRTSVSMRSSVSIGRSLVCPSEAGTRSVQERLGGRRALAHQSTGFCDREIVENHEGENGSLVRWERSHRGRDRGPIVEAWCAGRVSIHVELSHLELHPASFLTGLSPEVIRQLVPGDAADPRRGVGPTVEARPLLDGGDKRQLGDLLGKARIAP